MKGQKHFFDNGISLHLALMSCPKLNLKPKYAAVPRDYSRDVLKNKQLALVFYSTALSDTVAYTYADL